MAASRPGHIHANSNEAIECEGGVMTFLNAYLAGRGETPDPTFQEEDEAALVLFLFEARAHRSTVGLTVPDDPETLDRLAAELLGPTHEVDLEFVTVFLCYFYAKPDAYMRDMRQFRDYFVPGFSHDRAKQIQVAEGLRPRFFEATVADLREAESLDLFFDTMQIPSPVGASSFGPAGVR
jgi:hypothetical protein